MTRSFGGRSPVYSPVSGQTFDRADVIRIAPEEVCFPEFEFVGTAQGTGADATTVGSFTMGGDPSGTYYLVAAMGQRQTFDVNGGLSTWPISHPGCTTLATGGETAGAGFYQPAWYSLLKPNLPAATAPVTITPIPAFYAPAGTVHEYTVSVVRVTNAADYLGVFFPTEGWDNWQFLNGVGGAFELGATGTGNGPFTDAAPSLPWTDVGVCLWLHSRCGRPPNPTTFLSAVTLGGDLAANQQTQHVLAGPYPSYLDLSFTEDTDCTEPGHVFTGSLSATTTNFTSHTKLFDSIGAMVKGRT